MSKAIPILRTAGILIVIVLFFFACRTIPVAGVPHVSAYLQRLAPTSGFVDVATAVSVGPGWVVVFADDNGAPGDLLGYASVHDGINLDIPVPWSYAPRPGWYIAELHKDAGTVGKYEYPGPDGPVLGADGMPVMERFFLVDYNGNPPTFPPP
jgi:hypothetical protein